MFSKWYYLEYVAASIFGISVLYYLFTYIYNYFLFNFEPIVGTEEQRQLLKLDEKGEVMETTRSQFFNSQFFFKILDNTFITKTPDMKKAENDTVKADITALSWQQLSFNDCNVAFLL